MHIYKIDMLNGLQYKRCFYSLAAVTILEIISLECHMLLVKLLTAKPKTCHRRSIISYFYHPALMRISAEAFINKSD